MKKLEEVYFNRFKGQSKEDFNKHFSEYNELKEFKPNGNVFDENTNGISTEAHFIMRWTVGQHLEEAFKAMKIDLTDDNVKQIISEGNIGTPQRIAKVWCGYSDDDDTELGGGRWSKKPRIASFPNESSKLIPITKRVDIISNCSHHFLPFSTIARSDAYAIISYIPKNKVLGISKLQRVANHISQRFWLQEDLTKALYEEVSSVAGTDSVYVGIFNAVHSCESFRGAKTNDGAFSSEYYGGDFEKPEIRHSIK